MKLTVSGPAGIDAVAEPVGAINGSDDVDFELQFYKGRKYVLCHTLTTVNAKGILLDTAIIRVDQYGKIFLDKVRKVTPPGDEVDGTKAG